MRGRKLYSSAKKDSSAKVPLKVPSRFGQVLRLNAVADKDEDNMDAAAAGADSTLRLARDEDNGGGGGGGADSTLRSASSLRST
mmetsp:Transcript_47900/g.88851  ORF Transcript_47900/g.88851 Transcript_47900/m.88851 type:complete len:84 (+) Transcript_47900:650-901(+)